MSVHVVIPMSGSGERFARAGYKLPKPLIAVDGAPIIKYVVSMFNNDDRFTFICNEQHLAETDLARVLKELVPASEICPIAAHKKGPVYAVSQCFDRLRADEETIVNYCDFYSYWDYNDFLNHTRRRHASGAIPAYKGFHPHMLGNDNYAFMKGRNQWLEAIQEKKPFTENRMQEYASNGTYYFSRGEYIQKYFAQLMEENIQVNGEFYVSMVYNLLVRDGLPVSIYEVQHMLQWGTPSDLEEYQKWSEYFTNIVHAQSEQTNPVDIALIPMAGRGVRFVNEGYKEAKPLIPVSGKPMILQAGKSLPPAKRYIFVTLKEHMAGGRLEALLKREFSETAIVSVSEVTEGQAISCEVGLERADPKPQPNDSLLIGACDNGMVYDKKKFAELLADKNIDCASFSFRNHASSARRPKMYSWLKVEDRDAKFPKITAVSMKEPISDNPRRDHAVVGAFYFQKMSTFTEALQLLKEKNFRVNGEFYADSLIDMAIELGYHCVAFEIDDYICFGTPDDLRTFEYWQAFFHKCSWHPYKIEKDPGAATEDQELLKSVSRKLVQRFE
jgi:NDP-sugar pyrophosphorylase family protein